MTEDLIGIEWIDQVRLHSRGLSTAPRNDVQFKLKIYLVLSSIRYHETDLSVFYASSNYILTTQIILNTATGN